MRRKVSNPGNLCHLSRKHLGKWTIKRHLPQQPYRRRLCSLHILHNRRLQHRHPQEPVDRILWSLLNWPHRLRTQVRAAIPILPNIDQSPLDNLLILPRIQRARHLQHILLF